MDVGPSKARPFGWQRHRGVAPQCELATVPRSFYTNAWRIPVDKAGVSFTLLRDYLCAAWCPSGQVAPTNCAAVQAAIEV
jgi:hypothetical protein